MNEPNGAPIHRRAIFCRERRCKLQVPGSGKGAFEQKADGKRFSGYFHFATQAWERINSCRLERSSDLAFLPYFLDIAGGHQVKMRTTTIFCNGDFIVGPTAELVGIVIEIGDNV